MSMYSCCIWYIIAICTISGGHAGDWGGTAPAMPVKYSGDTQRACGFGGLNCGTPGDVPNGFVADAT